MRSFLFSVSFALGAMSTHAQAEVFILKSGKKLEGRIEHFYNGIFTVLRTNGTRKTLGINEIASIEFQKSSIKPDKTPLSKSKPSKVLPSKEPPKNLLETLTKAQTSKFGTPLQTFETWRKAAIAGSIKEMVACYVSYRQKQVRKELKKMPKAKLEEMRAATAQTDFFPNEPFYQGDRAALEIHWRKGLHGETQVLQFALEKNDWKIIQ